MPTDDRELKRLLWFVLGGARGGENRARLIHNLRERPSNLNQLAVKMGVDYRTILHHVEVLRSNSLIVSEGEKYGAVYFLSPRLETGIDIFDEIVAKLHFSLENE